MRRTSGPVGRLVQQAYAAGHAVRVVPAPAPRLRPEAAKRAVLDTFARGLDLPEWFGRNLDALVDALRELADDSDRIIELIWDTGDLAAVDPRLLGAVLSVLEQVEAERDDLTVTVLGPAGG